MTYQPTTIAVRLAASVCVLLSGVTGVSAQLQCGMANSAGPPIVHDADIFCGVINAAGNAGGFHSRPNGINPVHIPAGGGVPI
jgi:hypothetical protein